MNTAHGSYLYGELRFNTEMLTNWVAHCHCTLCRHGAAFVTWVGMEAARCTIDDPQGRPRWYEPSPGAEHGFCQRCGSTPFFRAGHH